MLALIVITKLLIKFKYRIGDFIQEIINVTMAQHQNENYLSRNNLKYLCMFNVNGYMEYKFKLFVCIYGTFQILLCKVYWRSFKKKLHVVYFNLFEWKDIKVSAFWQISTCKCHLLVCFTINNNVFYKFPTNKKFSCLLNKRHVN